MPGRQPLYRRLGDLDNGVARCIVAAGKRADQSTISPRASWRVEDVWPDGRILAMNSLRGNAAAGDKDTIRVMLN